MERRRIELLVGGWRISGGKTAWYFARLISYSFSVGVAVGAFIVGAVLVMELYRRLVG